MVCPSESLSWTSTAASWDARRRPPELTEILPNLFVGEYPRSEDVAWLKREFQINAVLSLQDSHDLAKKGVALPELVEEYRAHGIEFRHTPIADNDVDSLETALPRAVDELHALIDGGFKVLVHCNAGFNRAPTVTIAYLHARHAMPLEQARDFVKARRSCVPFMTVLQKHFRSRGRSD